jgi:hypothetical protein
MLKKIKQALATIGLKTSDFGVHKQGHTILAEDESAAKLRKRVNDAIDKQWNVMTSRVMRPHDFSCLEPMFCQKRNCFKWEPDKTIGEPYLVKVLPKKEVYEKVCHCDREPEFDKDGTEYPCLGYDCCCYDSSICGRT